MITFNQSRSDAFTYFKSLPVSKLQQRFDSRTTQANLDDALSECTTSSYLCALDNSKVVGVLDYYPYGYSRKLLPIKEIAIVVSQPGVGDILFSEFKRMYPNELTAAGVTGGSMKGIHFALTHCDMVMLDYITKLAIVLTMIAAPNPQLARQVKSNIITSHGILYDSDIDSTEKKEQLIKKMSMDFIYKLTSKRVKSVLEGTPIDNKKKQMLLSALHESIFYKKGV